MIRAILWDNDGVLVDTERLYFQACREIAGEFGVNLTRDLFIELSLRQGVGMFGLLQDHGIAEAEIPAIRARRNQRHSELLAQGNLINPGVAETLAELALQYRMAIVTSCAPDHFAITHRDTGILGYLEFVLHGHDYARHKPYPDGYLLALERMNLTPSDAVIVEDSPRGLAAAQAAGIRCVILRTALTESFSFDGAWHIITTVSELPALLQAEA